MVSQALRESVRALYDFRCGYCGVTETESGGQLEIDHFPDVTPSTTRRPTRTCRLAPGWPADWFDENARLREYVRELEQETERLLQIIAGLTHE